MKILIAVPTFESIYPDTYGSIYELDKGGHEVAFAFVRGYDCATARNRIAQKAINGNYDYVFMVDNDVVLPRTVLLDMLDDPKAVCLGYYAHRNENNLYNGRVSVCRLKDSAGNLYFNYPLESEYTAEELGRMREEVLVVVGPILRERAERHLHVRRQALLARLLADKRRRMSRLGKHKAERLVLNGDIRRRQHRS